MPPHPDQHPLTHLPGEDLDLIAELILQDGSLKDLAAAYGVSYPTIRARFTRVVERTREVMSGRTIDPVSELLATLVERGEVSPSAARTIKGLMHASQTTDTSNRSAT